VGSARVSMEVDDIIDHYEVVTARAPIDRSDEVS
jgi:hypothetical protein